MELDPTIYFKPESHSIEDEIIGRDELLSLRGSLRRRGIPGCSFSEIRSAISTTQKIVRLSGMSVLDRVIPILAWRRHLSERLVESSFAYVKKANKTEEVMNKGLDPLHERGCLGQESLSSKTGHVLWIKRGTKTRVGHLMQEMIASFSEMNVENLDDNGKEQGLDLIFDVTKVLIADRYDGGKVQILGRIATCLKDNDATQTGTHSSSALKKTIEAAKEMGCTPARCRTFGKSKLLLDENGVLNITGKPLWELFGLTDFYNPYRAEFINATAQIENMRKVTYCGKTYDIRKKHAEIHEKYKFSCGGYC